jgi:hypothetical protein
MRDPVQNFAPSWGLVSMTSPTRYVLLPDDGEIAAVEHRLHRRAD